jgi:hypothetical protein
MGEYRFGTGEEMGCGLLLGLGRLVAPQPFYFFFFFLFPFLFFLFVSNLVQNRFKAIQTSFKFFQKLKALFQDSKKTLLIIKTIFQ